MYNDTHAGSVYESCVRVRSWFLNENNIRLTTNIQVHSQNPYTRAVIISVARNGDGPTDFTSASKSRVLVRALLSGRVIDTPATVSTVNRLDLAFYSRLFIGITGIFRTFPHNKGETTHQNLNDDIEKVTH